MTIITQVNLDAAKFCREISGDLKIEPDFPTIDATALPYLKRVRGGLLSASPFMSPSAISITIANLEVVDGEVKVALLSNLSQFNLPRLVTAGSVNIGISLKVTRLSLPQLNTVAGVFAVGNLPLLGQIDVPRLSSVGGALSLQVLCKLPWSQVSRLATLGATQTIGDIGCCAQTSDRYMCNLCTCN